MSPSWIRLPFVLGLALVLWACESEEPGPAESLGKQIDESRDEAAKALEDAAERTREKLQEATEAVEKEAARIGEELEKSKKSGATN